VAVFDFVRNRILGNIFGFAVGAAASQAFEAPLREVAYEVEAALTNRVLTPEQLAELVIRGVIGQPAAAAEASKHGVNADRFSSLVALAGNPPGPQELLQLWNRGAIGEAAVDQGLRQGRLRPEWYGPLKQLREQLLTPGELAALTARGLTDPGAAAVEAGRQGLNADRFELLRRAGARPPALGEMLDLLNRGQVDSGAVTAALRDAGIRQEWVAPLLELRRVIPPLSDQVRFAVREARTPATVQRFGMDQDLPPDFVRAAAEVGLNEEDARLYWRAHWDLPSPEQGFRMLHRGIIDQPTLELLLRSLDVMPFWRQRMIELTYNVPGRIDLRRMFQHGVVNEGEVLAGYKRLGYAPADAETLTEFATVEKTEPERQLAKSEVVAFYEAKTIDRTEAARLLGLLGYRENDAGMMLDLADARRAKAYRNATIAVVRRRFLEGEVDAAEATARLDTIGVPTDEREQLLDLWSFERAENPTHMTEAQMRAAWRAGVVEEIDYRVHLGFLRYPANEAEVLVALYKPEAPQPARDLTEAQMRKAYKKELVTAADYRAHLARQGFDSSEVELLARIYDVQ
jgi:hypothetical protein